MTAEMPWTGSRKSQGTELGLSRASGAPCATDACGYMQSCDTCGTITCSSDECGYMEWCATCHKTACATNACGYMQCCLTCFKTVCHGRCGYTPYCEECGTFTCDTAECGYMETCRNCFKSTCDTDKCGYMLSCLNCFKIICRECALIWMCDECETTFCVDCGVVELRPSRDGPDWKCWRKCGRGSAKRCILWSCLRSLVPKKIKIWPISIDSAMEVPRSAALHPGMKNDPNPAGR